jgi:hypothetical protein
MHSGIWYLPTGTMGLSSTVNSNNVAIYVPFLIGKACTLNGIGAIVTSPGEAASVLRLGLYADVDGIPVGRIADYGTVAGNVAVAVSKVISQNVTPGWYWTSIATQLAPVTPPTLSSHQSSFGPNRVGDVAIVTNKSGCYFEVGVSGALPATASVGTGAAAVTSAIAVWLKAA